MTRVLAAAPDHADLTTLKLDPRLVAVLEKAAPVYRAVWWARHSAKNAERQKEYQGLIDRYGRQAVARLTSVYGTTWPAAPRVIDLVVYTNWAGAYSTSGPLIEVASVYQNTGGVIGLEILLHESSHQWDEEILRRVSTIAARQHKAVPDTLTHALIWYTTGTVVSELVDGHVPYADKYGLWKRGGLTELKPLLDKHWRPYLEGHGTFDEAIAAFFSDRQ